MQHLPKVKEKFQMIKKQFQCCLITSIVHIPSPETVSTSSDVTKNKVSSSRKSLGMYIMVDVLPITRGGKIKCGKY